MDPLRWNFQDLTPELRKYAEDTIGETEELKYKALADLRTLIKKNKDLNCRDDDKFLLRFLRTKKFDVDRAFKVLNNYYALQAKYQNVFTGKFPSDVKKIGDMKAIICLPHRLPPGSHICLFRLGSLDLREASAVEYIAFQLLFGEMILECESSQVCGGVNILDLRGLSFQHYTQFLSMSYVSLVISILQDCWPERVRAVHFLFEPAVLSVLYKCFKPILKSKFKERIHFHGSSLDSLHQLVSPDYLPEELGGNLGPLDNTEFVSYFLSQESFIKEIHSYGLVKQNKT